jgi:hypothetical protein
MDIDTDAVYTKYAYRYLEIGNPQQAALDAGVPKDSLNEFLSVARTHEAVLEIFAEDELAIPDFTDAEAVRKAIIKKLWREANFKGTGAQQTARIAALKTIGEIVGIEAAKEINLNNGGEGGVMMIPVVDAALWEESAEKMQRELKEKARE